jgi:hypothetical protein
MNTAPRQDPKSRFSKAEASAQAGHRSGEETAFEEAELNAADGMMNAIAVELGIHPRAFHRWFSTLPGPGFGGSFWQRLFFENSRPCKPAFGIILS